MTGGPAAVAPGSRLNSESPGLREPALHLAQERHERGVAVGRRPEVGLGLEQRGEPDRVLGGVGRSDDDVVGPQHRVAGRPARSELADRVGGERHHHRRGDHGHPRRGHRRGALRPGLGELQGRLGHPDVRRLGAVLVRRRAPAPRPPTRAGPSRTRSPAARSSRSATPATSGAISGAATIRTGTHGGRRVPGAHARDEEPRQQADRDQRDERTLVPRHRVPRGVLPGGDAVGTAGACVGGAQDDARRTGGVRARHRHPLPEQEPATVRSRDPRSFAG